MYLMTIINHSNEFRRYLLSAYVDEVLFQALEKNINKTENISSITAKDLHSSGK
jgi:hypothetical protein